MWKTHVGRVRGVGLLEGASFLVLLLIAMPLKYGAGIDEAVFVVGMLHGVLFVLYLLVIAHAFFARRFSFGMSALAVAASIVPFGPFWLDRKLR
ncbi:MAG TPA: DUF3817 domain-containing protein [Paenibacillus sp.]|uniref:DUF3817 domain-containing protein n=1 Tax=Paenibacillus sp. TaxID=58172 RepID=UPI002B59CF94|nr:DUF3817 domain-containing protein [Paenibacillus sp.]HUC94335.1 DUF3817 domain-containing protein [Paenibacillus sp.]